MNPLGPVLKIGEVIAKWLDPERLEKARLERKIKIQKRAIEAAQNLIALYQAQYEKTGGGVFRAWPPRKIEEYKVHYTKQFNAWQDGET